MMVDQLEIWSIPPEQVAAPVRHQHDFDRSLAISHKAADLPIWEEIYRQTFPGFLGMVDCRQDGHHQRQGVDRIVSISTELGVRQVLIDEKIRPKFCLESWKRRPFSFDVAVEYAHEGHSYKAAGWVCKPMDAQFIAYVVAVLGQGCLLPVPQLQQAWARHGQRWICAYREPRHRSFNKRGRYWTYWVPVPLAELFQAIGAEYRFSCTPVLHDLED
jgi:hypothetical protein